MIQRILTYFRQETGIAPLVTLRVLFGFIMAVSIIRFIAMGWVYDLYIKPQFFFSYYGFEWLPAPSPFAIFAVFILMLVSALGIMTGFFYRISAILFFVLFTYVELLDKTNYLNHYYFVSLISFLLIWVPANRYFSFDVILKPSLAASTVPNWVIDLFKFQLAIVYIFAGIAKINSAWLLEAMPLRIWLPANSHLPFIGNLLSEVWVAYAFSWAGMIYDLFIVFFLLNATTRIWAYGAVIVFHIITWLLFPIGMFPFIMILSTLIFFSEQFHTSLIGWFSSNKRSENLRPMAQGIVRFPRILIAGLALFFIVQVIMPWRYLLYPGELFWTEQGYRFSWRVMLMEKAGFVIFHVKDPMTGREGDVMPEDYLTPVQVKMMSTQPDMIVQFAHFLEKEYKKKGIEDLEVRVDAYVTLNGSGSRPFIEPELDLTRIEDSFEHKDWILAFK